MSCQLRDEILDNNALWSNHTWDDRRAMYAQQSTLRRHTEISQSPRSLKRNKQKCEIHYTFCSLLDSKRCVDAAIAGGGWERSEFRRQAAFKPGHCTVNNSAPSALEVVML